MHVPLFIAGLIFGGLGLLLLVKELKKRKTCTETVEAEVTGYLTEVDEDAETNSKTVSYYPLLRYWVAGADYEGRDSVGRGKQRYEIGERVQICYDRNDPQTFFMVGDKASVVMPAVFSVLGIGLIVLAFLV